MNWRFIKKKNQRDKEKWERDYLVRLEGTVKCEYCGHKNLIPAERDKKLCSWCHRIVWNHTRAHFIRKMLKLLKKE